MKLPIILILSEGNVKPVDIVNKIRKIPENEEKERLMNYLNESILAYEFHLTTKYYKTNLHLVPFEHDITLLPSEIQENIECVLIYFDAGKRSFSERIATYAKFIKDNNIELGILLCNKLYDDSNEGITYKEAKQQSRFLDVIELERTREESDDDDNHRDPLGYDELLQALRSFVWSNVDLGSSSEEQRTDMQEKPNYDDDTSDDNKSTPSADSLEAELEAFEKLLVEVMDFKNLSSNWTRNERIVNLEKFANKFESLIGEDDEEN